MKQNAIDIVPADLILPNIYLDFEKFEETCKRYEVEIEIGNDIVNDDSSSEYFWIKSYFMRMVTMLKTLNCIITNNEIGNRDMVIGFELNIGADNFYIFPDTEFNQELVCDIFCQYIIRHKFSLHTCFYSQYNQLTIEKLCDISTGLTFVNKSNDENCLIESDIFGLKIHRISMLFHSLLSLSINPWICILNNSIIGHPIDNLKKFIKQFQLNSTGNSRQMIIVCRKPNEYCDSIFEQDYLQICCEKIQDGPLVFYQNFSSIE